MRSFVAVAGGMGVGLATLVAPAADFGRNEAWNAWRAVAKSGPREDLGPAARAVRDAARRWAAAHGSSPAAARYSPILAADGLETIEIAHRLRGMRASPEIWKEYAAATRALAHHVTVDPNQVITDFRDRSLRVEVAADRRLDYTDAVTWCVWIRIEGDVSVRETKIVSHAGVEDGKLAIMIEPGNRISVVSRLSDGTRVRRTWEEPLPSRQWVHLALSFGRSQGFLLYYNGRPIPPGPGDDTGGRTIASRPEQALYIGGLDRSLPGLIDDVRVYGRALVAEEIALLVKGGEVEPGAAGHWPFDTIDGGRTPNRAPGGPAGSVGAEVRLADSATGLPGRSLRFSPPSSAWVVELRRLEGQRDTIERRFLSKPAPAEPATGLERLVESLRARGAVLVHLVADATTDALEAYLLDPSAAEPVRSVRLGSAARASEAIAVLRAAFDAQGGTEAGYRLRARAAARIIWDPVEDLAPSSTNVLLRLDAGLGGVPWGALVGRDGRYLVESWAFADAGPLAGISKRAARRTTGKILALGNPSFSAIPESRTAELLGTAEDPAADGARGPGTARCLVSPRRLFGTKLEVENLRRVAASRADRPLRVLTWDDAFETRLRAELPGAYVVHVASHSYRLASDCLTAAPRDPALLRGVQLAGVDRARPEADRRRDDGFLSVSEIEQLPLDGVALLALSGCSTSARGEPEAADSIANAAWIAGAGASLMTTRDVADLDVPELVALFYDAWLGGDTLPESLRRSLDAARRRALLEEGESHPARWAMLALEGA